MSPAAHPSAAALRTPARMHHGGLRIVHEHGHDHAVGLVLVLRLSLGRHLPRCQPSSPRPTRSGRAMASLPRSAGAHPQGGPRSGHHQRL